MYRYIDRLTKVQRYINRWWEGGKRPCELEMCCEKFSRKAEHTIHYSLELPSFVEGEGVKIFLIVSKFTKVPSEGGMGEKRLGTFPKFYLLHNR